MNYILFKFYLCNSQSFKNILYKQLQYNIFRPVDGDEEAEVRQVQVPHRLPLGRQPHLQQLPAVQRTRHVHRQVRRGS